MSTDYAVEITKIAEDKWGVVCRIGIDRLAPPNTFKVELFQTEKEALKCGMNFMLGLLDEDSQKQKKTVLSQAFKDNLKQFCLDRWDDTFDKEEFARADCRGGNRRKNIRMAVEGT